ncbi:MAG: electron transfer flavoprotein subunit alpha/FixB family protein [Candidatus Caldarchaeum sp.]|nr:electron transfer flavoprotein subunit alpha/FixB family protein [Candidatus Caldarchaeum sp.]MCX8200743.1 electron transfer flavoprotein subunit alpha/FixB family protein [Candidatus Caldarchaeum sp.]
MKALVFGEKPEQTASLAAYLSKAIQPETTYAAAFTEYSPTELETVGGAGVKKIYVLPDKNWHAGPASTAHALSELAKQNGVDIVVVYASKKGNEIAARTAQRLDASYASEVISVERSGDAFLVKRLVLGGGYVASLLLRHRPSVVSIKPASENIVPGDKPVVERLNIVSDAPEVKFLESIKPEKAHVDLEKAGVVVAVGRGFKKKEDLAMAEELARIIGAEVGCSRPISGDLKWLEEERHIGLSGKRVRPSLYIALGISGQVQHLVGMRDSKTVIAVNTDPNAPMAIESDYFFVADLYKILPTTIESLKKKLVS